MKPKITDGRFYQVKKYGIGSWLDPRSRGRLSAEVGTKLEARVKGEKGVVLALTYDRSKYDSPRDLYVRQSEEQHVPLFIRKLSRKLGISFKGKWFRKLEFQSGGWVHFHIILLGVSRIDYELLKQCWGHGHVWVNRLTARGAKYLCKYIAKSEEDIPAFIYIDRPRSFKVIAVSPGFWRRDDDDPPELIPVAEVLPSPATTLPVYVSLGQRLEDSEDLILIEDLETGFQRRVAIDMGMFLAALAALGVSFNSGDRGRVCFVASESRELLPAIERVLRESGEEPAASAAGPRLPLLKTSNPDAVTPRWIDHVVMDGMQRCA